MPTQKLSVILPGYNEKASVRSVIARYCATLDRRGVDYEIIVIDDASTDGMTSEVYAIAAETPQVRIIHNPANLGQARSILVGFSAARGDVLTHNAFDLAFAPEDSGRALDLLESGADVVVVQRANRNGYDWKRKLLSLANVALVKALFRSPFVDHNFVQFYRRQVFKDTCFASTGVSTVTLEMILRAIRAGYRVTEMRADYHERRVGRSTVTPDKVVHALFQTVLLAWQIGFGPNRDSSSSGRAIETRKTKHGAL